jgi:uncharacterized delta-60 repeat protein
MARFVAPLVLTLALFPATAVAAPGDLDRSFGNAGVGIFDWGGASSATGILVQPDGRIVASGGGGSSTSIALVGRLNSNGAVDGAFGSGGLATAPVAGATYAWAVAVARQADGKLVGAGLTSTANDDKGLVVRLTANGQLDGSFGAGGIVVLDYGAPVDALWDVLVQPDGKVLVAGHGGPGNTLVVTRLAADGTPDASFSDDGTATMDVGAGAEHGFVALQPDGKVVAVADSSVSGISVVRLNANGTPDAGFGTGGRLQLQLASGQHASDLLVQPDSRIVVLGHETGSSFLITRLTPDGSYDADFSNGEGLAAVGFGSSDTDEAHAAALQANGKLIVAGRSITGTTRQLAVARLQPNGELDTTFSGDGKQTLPAPSTGESVALQRDGRILVGGDNGDDTLVVRLQGDGGSAGGGPSGGGSGGGGGGGGGGGSKSKVPRCGGKRATIVGTNRSDKLKGTRRSDVIVSLGGNDKIAAGRGNDVICAGEGNDKLDGGLGNDRLYGQNGKDNLIGASGKDKLDGGSGKDQLSGGSGRDSCNGGNGKDRGYCERNRSL